MSSSLCPTRNANLKIVAKLTSTQLARSGYLEPPDDITLGRLLELWVEHDRGHIQELEKLRTLVGKLHNEVRTQGTCA